MPELGPSREAPAPPDFLVVGEVVAPSGVHGAIKVKQVTDFPERFDPGSRLFVRGRPHEVEWSRPWKGPYFVVKLRGVDTRDQAAELRSATIEVPTAEAMPLPPGQYYYYQILGLDVYTPEGEILGQVVDILSTGANDVYVVRKGRQETLFPAIAEVVRAIDLDLHRIVVEPMASQ